MKGFIFFIFNFFIAFCGIAQDEIQQDTIVAPKKILTAISLSADFGKIVVGNLSDFENKYSYTAQILFLDHFNVSYEMGKGTITPENAFKNVDYTVNGTFQSMGLDYVRKIKLKNYISFGLRKSFGEFSDEGTISVISDSELSEDYERTFKRNNLEADWWELIISSETRLASEKSRQKKSAINQFAKNFYLGVNFRLKFLLDYTAQEGIDINSIPGYGRTFDKTSPAINLYFKYRLGF